jgi:hypothetical protein
MDGTQLVSINGCAPWGAARGYVCPQRSAIRLAIDEGLLHATKMANGTFLIDTQDLEPFLRRYTERRRAERVPA